MKASDLKYALLAIVAAVAGFLGLKAGRRGADKRVSRVAGEAAERMDDERRERMKEKLREIDSRPVTDDPAADLRASIRKPRP